MPQTTPIHRRRALTGIAAATTLALSGLALLSLPTQAAPAKAAQEKTSYRGAPLNPAPYTVTQPDGTKLRVRNFGDHLQHGVATVKGNYTLVKGNDGTWRYASGLTAAGKLKASSIVAGHGAAPKAAKGLVPAPIAKAAQKPVPKAGVGDDTELVILVEFDDQPSIGSTEAEWANHYFGATGSVDDFYDEVSQTQFGLEPAAETCGTANNGVTDWIPLGYDHPNTGITNGPDDYVADAIEAASSCVDFASFDTDDSGDITTDELHITVIGAGQETSYAGPGNTCEGGPSIWGHQWDLNSGSTVGAPTVDGVVVGADGYTTFGEWHCAADEQAPDTLPAAGHKATIGIMAHEFGHDINWPDLYDVDGTSEGIGEFSLMSGGSWGEDTLPGDSPAHPDAWALWYQDWVTPTPVLTATDNVDVDAGESVLVSPNPGGVDWLFGEHTGTGEYFLIENRQPNGYDQSIPGCGLVAYRIDETVTQSNGANSNEDDPLVHVIEADGLDEMHDGVNRGDDGDPYPGSTDNDTLNDTSDPSTKFSGGTSSNLDVHIDSTTCSDTMTLDVVTPGIVSPPVVRPANDNFAAATAISGLSGTRTQSTEHATEEPGEPLPAGAGMASVWFKWTAPVSGNVTMSTLGSDYDTVLGLYTGSAVNALTEVASNDDEDNPGGVYTSAITSHVTKGTVYRIAGDGYAGDTGELKLTWGLTADPKVASTVSAKAPKRVVFKRDFKVKAKVSASQPATGKVMVFDGKKKIGKGTLNAKGKVKIKITKNLKVGKHKLTVKYLGSETVAAGQDKVKVKIVQRHHR